MQVVLDFANEQVIVDGDGPELVTLFGLIRDIAPQLPSIIFKHTSGSPKPGGGTGNGNGNVGAPSAFGRTSPEVAGQGITSQTMRQFVRSLALTSHAERVAAIAYYQMHGLKTTAFAPKEMNDWFVQCGLEKPAQMSVAISDTRKRNGFVESSGHGMWRLSTQGENFIIRKLEEASETGK